MTLFGLSGRKKSFTFKCTDCGDIHEGAPSFSYQKPSYYFDVPEEERETRIDINDDLCVIRPSVGDTATPTFHFIRTTLEIPIHEMVDTFMWGLWVSVSEASYQRYVETIDEDQAGEGCFGWLAVSMPHYNQSAPGEELTNLACNVYWASDNQRPSLELHECDHLLYRDQSEGISVDKAVEIFRHVAHG